MENLLVPYQAVTEIPCSKAVVLAPHPDDEIFGCGGAILRHLARGDAVRVIVVSDGAYGLEGAARTAQTLARQQESRAAAAVLGCCEPEFWGMRDREVMYGEKLVRRILECLEDADLVYAPSVFEMHPDHRALGMAAVEAVRRCGKEVRLALYEVGMPLRPNLLLDISDLMARKQAAMACFVSQNAIQRYDLDIAALNRYRTYTLPDNVTAAEAYILTGTDELVGDPFGLYQSERDRQRALGLHLDGARAPLVSVIIRSMDRPTLTEALDSVALQTYPNIEVVLVNAKGAAHHEAGEWCGRFPLRTVSTGQPLPRSRAANLGLDAAHGEYLIFLDDDDWFDAAHIDSLVREIERRPDVKVAYSGARCVDGGNNPLPTQFGLAHDATQLLAGNYIPIHTALFSRTLLDAGCRVDESLDLYEDWDFWIQASTLSDFLYVEGNGAVYRVDLQSGFGVVADSGVAEKASLVLFKKWLPRLKEEQVVKLMHAVRLNRLKDQQLADKGRALSTQETLARELAHEKGEILERALEVERKWGGIANALWKRINRLKNAFDMQCSEAQGKHEQMGRQIIELEQELSRKVARLAEVECRLNDLVNSRSWRVTAPLRKFKSFFSGDEKLVDFLHIAETQSINVLRDQPSSVDDRQRRICQEHQEFLVCFRSCDELTDEVRWAMRAQIDAMRYQPIISVRLSMLGHDPNLFQMLLDSVRGQLYPRWELNLMDSDLASEENRALADKLCLGDSRIKLLLDETVAIEGGQTSCNEIYGDWIYQLCQSNPPTELTFYRLAFYLLRHNAYIASRIGGEGAGDDDYNRWLKASSKQHALDTRAVLLTSENWSSHPKISIIMPVYNVPERWLRRAIESVLRQSYGNWELCVADDCSSERHVREVLEEFQANDERIKITYRETNGHISATSNSALELASGEFVALLDHDDELDPDALLWVANEIHQHQDVALIYSDEDKITPDGRLINPYFKPDWNPDLLLSHNMISHLGVYRTELIKKIGGFRQGYEGSQDWDLALRVIERVEARQIRHIPRVLYHWRMIPSSTSMGVGAKPYAVLASIMAIKDHLERCGVEAIVSEADGSWGVRVRYALPSNRPLLSIIILTRNGLAYIQRCVSSILDKTDYSPYEIIIVDNGSDDVDTLEYLAKLQDISVRVIRDDSAFNFAMLNNRAVSQARGEVIALVNNDIEIINSDWAAEMVGHALRPEVGVVGARLWYPDDTLQHGGIILAGDLVALHAHKHIPRGNHGYFGRAALIQGFSAVTAACMMFRREVYEESGGLDENLAVSYNDVDFCLRVKSRGYRILWTPYAQMYHHESATRGYEDTNEKQQRFKEESRLMKERWGRELENDPAYNPNLALDREDFSLAMPPRKLPC